MNTRAIAYVIFLLLLVVGVAMATSIPVSLMMDDPYLVAFDLACCAGGISLLSVLGIAFTRRRRGEPDFRTGSREGFVSVTFAWIAATLAAAVPFFVISDLRLADAVFESASGLSTTGASVLDSSLVLRTGANLAGGLERLPAGLLYWRSLINWLGGIGIVVFVLLILPLLRTGAGGYQLYNAEVPGIKTSSDQATPRLVSSVRLILIVYLILTLLATVVYNIGGMTFFDAVCHAFSTVSTGGFSTKQASLGFYSSAFLQWSAIVFMLVSACNFTLTVKMFLSRKIYYFRDDEFKFFFGLAAAATVFLAVLLYFSCRDGIPGTAGQTYPHSVESCLRTAAFQVSTILSTTGFVTSDYEAWHLPAALTVLFLLMFPCGCGGSTAGGMKCARVLIVVKQAFSEIRHCVFPRSLTDIRLNGVRLEDSIISKTMAFMFLYLILFLLVGALLPLLCDMDMTTSFTASLACLSNIGPGMGRVGPSGSFAWMSDSAKYLLSFTMLAGRLELYTCLVLLMPSFWKK